jgi:hypothetical protein
MKNNLNINDNKTLIINILILSIFILIISYIIGTRDNSVGTDTQAYRKFYDLISLNLDTRISEPFFLFLGKIAILFQFDSNSFLMLISVISFLSYLFFYYKLLELHNNSYESMRWIFILIALTLTIISPFFWNSQINVIRAGLSIPIFFISIFFYYQKNYLKAFIVLVLSVSTHFSILLFLPFLLFFKINIKKILVIFCILSLLYITGITQNIFIILSQKFYSIGNLSYYFDNALNERGYKGGIRYDFWVFTAFFFFIIYKYKKNTYLSDFLIKFYFILTLPFLLLGYINFSDRLILAAWNLIPAIISYYIISNFKIVTNTYIYIFLLLIFVTISLISLLLHNLLYI